MNRNASKKAGRPAQPAQGPRGQQQQLPQGQPVPRGQQPQVRAGQPPAARVAQPPAPRMGQQPPSVRAPQPPPARPPQSRPASSSPAMASAGKRPVEVMYPDKLSSIVETKNELQRRYDQLIKEKTLMEAQFNKERKTLRQEKLQMEENYKVLEELVSEGNPELTNKLEEAEKKNLVLEQRCKSKEEAIQTLTAQLKSKDSNDSSLKNENSRAQQTIKEQGFKLEQLAGIVKMLEGKLEGAKDGTKFKEMFEDSEKKKKDIEEKLKVALADNKPKQQYVKMQEKINQLKDQAKQKLLEKEKEVRSLRETVKVKEKEFTSLEQRLQNINKEFDSSQKLYNDETVRLKSYISNIEKENNDLKSSVSSINIQQSKEWEVKMGEVENKHFQQVNNLQEEKRKLEKSKIEELSKLEDEWVQKMAEHNSSFEKIKIKLKVSEKMSKESVDAKENLQSEVARLHKAVEEKAKEIEVADKKAQEMEEELSAKAQEKEELMSRCLDAEKRLTETSDQIYQLDSNNSYRTKLEYEVNFLKEKLRRIENGVEVPVSAPVYQPEPVLDENEMFLRFLDVDTSEIIRDLQTKLAEKESKVEELSKVVTEKDMEILVMDADMITKDDAWSAIQELLGSVETAGVSHSLHRAKVDGLTRQLEVKESEVLWVKSEAEEKVEKLTAGYEEENSSLRAEVKQIKRDFSLINQRSGRVELQELEKTLEEKEKAIKEAEKAMTEKDRAWDENEDHYTREIEILKQKNKKISEELDSFKVKDLTSAEEAQKLKDELFRVKRENEKLMAEASTADQGLYASFQDLEDQLKSKDFELEKEREQLSVLNESLEIEKVEAENTRKEKENLEKENSELQGELLAFKEKENDEKVSKKNKLEVETLKSELERTKLKLKEAQEASIKVHEDLFIEHKVIVETVKSWSAKKRKRLFEDVHENTKKLRGEEAEDVSNVPVAESLGAEVQTTGPHQDSDGQPSVQPSVDGQDQVEKSDETSSHCSVEEEANVGPVEAGNDTGEETAEDKGDMNLLDDTIENSFNDPKDNIATAVVENQPDDTGDMDINDFNIEKLELMVDQASESSSKMMAAGTGVGELNLDDAEFIVDQGEGSTPGMTSLPSEETDQESEKAPTIVLQSNWVM